MIRINLLGRGKVKAVKAKKFRTASNQAMQLIMAISVVVISIGVVYFWERALVSQEEEISRQIVQAKKEKVRQEGMLKENEAFEKRRKLLENRINVIESLKKKSVRARPGTRCPQRLYPAIGGSLVKGINPKRQSDYN